MNKFFVFLLLLLSCLAAQADPVTIRGTVTDADDGSPLIGVAVNVKGTNASVTTDLNGQFAIKADLGQTLMFNYIGYQPTEVRANKQNLEVSMREKNEELNELVVVGYGTMKRSDLTGATVSVGSADIAKSFSTSIDQALQGRAAGVQVTQNSGAPGGGISVSIRGTNTLSSNEPLYIIDGIAISGETGSNSSALSGIAPGDILSMEVLKDASATAIYGAVLPTVW